MMHNDTQIRFLIFPSQQKLQEYDVLKLVCISIPVSIYLYLSLFFLQESTQGRATKSVEKKSPLLAAPTTEESIE